MNLKIIACFIVSAILLGCAVQSGPGSYTVNVSAKDIFRHNSLTDSDKEFLRPAYAADSACVASLNAIPPEPENKQALDAAYQQQCSARFNEIYKQLFGECDQQRAKARSMGLGPTTQSFIKAVSTCEGETADFRRRAFYAIRENGTQAYRSSDQIIDRRVAENLERERQRNEALTKHLLTKYGAVFPWDCDINDPKKSKRMPYTLQQFFDDERSSCPGVVDANWFSEERGILEIRCKSQDTIRPWGLRACSLIR